MKKSIKYGSAIASAAAAALAMSGSAFAAKNIADTVDTATCGINTIYVSDAAAGETESLVHQAQVNQESAACYEAKANEVEAGIVAQAKELGIYVELSSGGANWSAITTKANGLVNSFTGTYGVKTTTEAALKKALGNTSSDVTKPWVKANVATDGKYSDDGLYDVILEDAAGANVYGGKEIIDAWNAAVKAQAIIAGVDSDSELAGLKGAATAATKAAEEIVKNLEAKADDAETAAKTADANEEKAETAFGKVVTTAEGEIDRIKEAGFSDETVAAVEEQLEAAKKGEKADFTEANAKAGIDLKAANEECDVAYHANIGAIAAVKNKQDAFDAIKDSSTATSEEKQAAYADLLAAQEARKETQEAYNTLSAKVRTMKTVLDTDSKLGDAEIAVKRVTNKAKALETAKTTAEEQEEIAKKARAAANKAAGIETPETPVTPGTEEPGSEEPGTDTPGTTDPTDEPGSTDPTDEPGSKIDVNPETGEPYTYAVIGGTDQVYTTGKTLSFEFDGDHTRLDKVYINGKELDRSNYTVTKGSTVITLKNAYLDTLAAGDYVLRATWLDGSENSVAFVVADAAVSTKVTPDTGAATSEGASAVASLAGIIATASIAGAAVVLRKRSA